jgi:hypothetical protein
VRAVEQRQGPVADLLQPSGHDDARGGGHRRVVPV